VKLKRPSPVQVHFLRRNHGRQYRVHESRDFTRPVQLCITMPAQLLVAQGCIDLVIAKCAQHLQ